MTANDARLGERGLRAVSDAVLWEDPPAINKSGPRRSPWEERLAPLRDHPGRWANLGDWHARTAKSIKDGVIGRARQGEFEAVMRGVNAETKHGTLYVRYVGEGQ